MEIQMSLTHILLLALAFHTGESIKCYSCSSALEPKCADPMNTELQMTECSVTLINDAVQGFNKVLSKLGEVAKLFGQNKNTQIKATPDQFACMKTVIEEGDTRVVTRSCGLNPSTNDLCKHLEEGAKDQTKGKLAFCEACTGGDGCNGAGTATAIAALVLPALALLIANS